MPEISTQSKELILIRSGTSPLKKCSQQLVAACSKTLTSPDFARNFFVPSRLTAPRSVKIEQVILVVSGILIISLLLYLYAQVLPLYNRIAALH